MILVLGGTSDSLSICELLNHEGLDYIVSVTTDYGKELCLPYTHQVTVGKLDLDEMSAFIKKHTITQIIDATHPYAVEVSRTAMEAAGKLNINYIRYERKSLLEAVSYEKLITVNSLEEAIMLAKDLGKRIFLGTGSKNLKLFWDALGEKTLIARVLPTSEVLKTCEEIGFSVDGLIAMKGPFSTTINIETFKHYQIDLLITKESGKEGGFLEKVEAAQRLNIPVIVIKRQLLGYTKVTHHISEVILKDEKEQK